jgi:hypothetical protein
VVFVAMAVIQISKSPDWHWLADNIGFDNYSFGGLPDDTKWKYSVYIASEKMYVHLNTSESMILWFLLRWL